MSPNGSRDAYRVATRIQMWWIKRRWIRHIKRLKREGKSLYTIDSQQH